MRFFESLLYVVSVFFVVAYVIFLGVMLFHDKGRRTLVLAVRSLWLHKMRAILSVLGIIIGTVAVIALMAFGEGSMQDALEDIKRLGATNIIVRSVKPPDDSVTLRAPSWPATASRRRITTAFRRSRRHPHGADAHFSQADLPRPVHAQRPHCRDHAGVQRDQQDAGEAGRFLVNKDSREMRNVCVLGASVAAKLFPFGNPIDQTILIDKFSYVVVGVAAERMPTAGSGGNIAAEDFNSDVYIPMGTAEGRFGKTVFLRQPAPAAASRWITARSR